MTASITFYEMTDDTILQIIMSVMRTMGAAHTDVWTHQVHTTVHVLTVDTCSLTTVPVMVRL